MLFAGIDWSDQTLDYHLRTAEGEVLAQGEIRPNLEGLIALYGKLDAHAPPDQIGIAVETAHGAWIQPLLDRGYRIYPVNPKSVDSFREALSANGNKSDAIDRKVLAMFLVTFHQDLRPLRPDDPQIISLRIAGEDRVRLVQERTAKLCELEAVVKIYYPIFRDCSTTGAAFGRRGGADAAAGRRFCGGKASWFTCPKIPLPERYDPAQKWRL
jgi:transposase